MSDCPTCEYHKKRAQIWRDEAYRLGGHPLPERKNEWVGLTDEEIDALESATDTLEFPQTVRAIEAKLKEKNT